MKAIEKLIGKRTLNSIITCHGNITIDVLAKITDVTHQSPLIDFQ